jgi:hypothetical protein
VSDSAASDFAKGALVGAVVSGVLFGVLMRVSWRNSVHTGVHAWLFARAWVAHLAAPMVGAIAVGVVRSIRPRRGLKAVLLVLTGAAGLGGLLVTSAGVDSVCKHPGWALTQTVRSDCFVQNGWYAAVIWTLVCIAVSLALPRRNARASGVQQKA